MAAVGMPIADQQVTRALLKWAVGRLPKPKFVTRRSAKLGELLVQAGFKAHGGVAVFQVCKLVTAVCGLLLGLIPSLAFSMRGGRVIMLTIVGAAVGSFIPGYYLNKRAKVSSEAVTGEGDLVSDVAAGRQKLAAIKDNELPDHLRSLQPAQREQELDKQLKRRNALNEKLAALVAKRDKYVAEARDKAPKALSFDRVVEDTLKAQIKR